MNLAPLSARPLLSRREEIETPEHVALNYDLADLGSRFTALIIDGLIITISLVLLALGISFLTFRLGGLSEALASWGFALLIFLFFAFFWGYFVYFEAFGDGQTPGKRLLRIRAVHDGGYPLTLQGAAIRNLLRLIDIQPAASMLVGGIAMMLHPRTKRVGDMVAGTIVVRERLAPSLPEDESATTPAPGAYPGSAQPPLPSPPRLRPDELATLSHFLARRATLPEAARDRIAVKLVERLAPRLEPDDRLQTLPPTDYLALIHAEELARQTAAGGVRATGSALATALARRQRPVWNEYRALLERARRRGLAKLPEQDVSRFAALYRETAADLARARTYGASDLLLYSLERWVGAGHNLLYRPADPSWRAFRAWLAAGFPSLVRRRWQPIALATILLALPAIITWSAVREEPTRAFALLPANMIARAEEAPQREAAGGEYVEIPEVFMPVMASSIIANNIQVTFLAFSGGILAGLGTLAILVFNGVHLGGVAGLFASHGASWQLWSFVLPHGIIELTAICIAGGAGLWLGSGIILPGRLTRREAVIRRGREVVSLMAGVIMLLIVAGMIEGFISPAQIPRALKLLFAIAFALLLALYLLAAGRGESNAGLKAGPAASPRDNG